MERLNNKPRIIDIVEVPNPDPTGPPTTLQFLENGKSADPLLINLRETVEWHCAKEFKIKFKHPPFENWDPGAEKSSANVSGVHVLVTDAAKLRFKYDVDVKNGPKVDPDIQLQDTTIHPKPGLLLAAGVGLFMAGIFAGRRLEKRSD